MCSKISLPILPNRSTDQEESDPKPVNRIRLFQHARWLNRNPEKHMKKMKLSTIPHLFGCFRPRELIGREGFAPLKIADSNGRLLGCVYSKRATLAVNP
jgi:hypothetical protein